MTRRLQSLGIGMVAVFAFANLGHTDVLHLRTGGQLEGVLTRETATTLTIDVGMGRVSVQRASVLRIERGQSPLSEYRTRLAGIAQGDMAALADLARFAGDNGLSSESQAMWARVAALDSRNVEAHLALGHVLVGGAYVDEAEAQRSRGLVSFDGRWMTTAEQASLLRQREERAADGRRADADRRDAQAAEDRARRAEASASRARSEAARSASFPIWGYSSPFIVSSPRRGYNSGCYGVGCSTHRRSWPTHSAAPVATPRPRVAPVRPSSIR